MAIQAIDFSDLGGKQVSPVPVASATPAGKIDFSDLGGTQVQAAPQQPTTLSKTTGISAGSGFLQQKWNEVKQGLASAQEGGGLSQQPTALGNAAQFAGALGTEAAQLGVGPELAASGLTKAGQVVSEALPSTKMANAGKLFNQLRGQIGQHTVEMTDKLGDALTDIKMAADSGTTLPTPVNKFVTRIADLEKGPLSYEEARNFYHNVSDLAASDRMAMNKNAQRLVLQFKSALGDTIANTVDKAGKLQTYQDAMQGFASGAKMQEKLNQVKDLVVKGAGTAALGGAAYETARKLISLASLGH